MLLALLFSHPSCSTWVGSHRLRGEPPKTPAEGPAGHSLSGPDRTGLLGPTTGFTATEEAWVPGGKQRLQNLPGAQASSLASSLSCTWGCALREKWCEPPTLSHSHTHTLLVVPLRATVSLFVKGETLLRCN